MHATAIEIIPAQIGRPISKDSLLSSGIIPITPAQPVGQIVTKFTVATVGFGIPL